VVFFFRFPDANCRNVDGQNFPVALCRALTPEKLAYLSRSACGGLKSECAAQIPVESWSTFPEQCFTNLDSYTLHYVDADRLAALPATLCAAAAPYMISPMNSSASYALTPACVGALATNCRGFEAAAFAGLTIPAFQNISKACVANLEAKAWNLVTAAQMAALTPTACSGFGSWTQYGINATAYAGISVECFSAWGGCNNVNTDGIPYLNASIFSVITPKCLNSLSAKKVTADQVSQIPVSTFAQWQDVSSISAQALSGTNVDQLLVVRPNNFGSFK
jgi:hypothetical protein